MSNERTKLVVRHLPPTLPEKIFWKTLDPWLQPISLQDGTVVPPKCTATFKSYVPGKVRQNKSKIHIPSRAYIQFLTPDQVVEFHQGYSNQAFRDSHGNLTFPKVEFAPYQRVAGPPKKIDSRIGTIEADREYQAFLETLNAPPPESNPELNNSDPDGEKVDPPQITPLIEHLRNVRKAAQDASVSTKQQRHPTLAHSSGQSTPGSRSSAGPPQIMKRVVGSNSNNPPSGSTSQKPRDSSSTNHDQPPHLLTSSSKESKRTKPSSPLPISSPNPQPSSDKSRPVKPPKSKKNGRGGEDVALKSEPQFKNPTNLQPPKPPTDPTSLVTNPKKIRNKEFPKNSPVKNNNNGNSSNWKDEESGRNLNHHHQNNINHGKSSNHSNHEVPKKSNGRAMGRGGKSLSYNKSNPPSSNQQAPEFTFASISKSLDQSYKSETAAARRRLDMALAGISVSKSDRSNPSSSNKNISASNS